MIGQQVSHYKILEELGSGGMGVVYKARDVKLNRLVALKFILPSHIKKKRNLERFINEAQAAAAINHPNICTVYEIEEQGESAFIVMEYIEGIDLRALSKKKPMELGKALDFAVQIAEGLQEAHEKGIIHRDIKSSNIIVTSKNQVKIMDFGLAKISGDTGLSETKAIKGTVSYMSPEQALGGEIDCRTDIWSFGVVLYEMLSGKLPFEGTHEPLVLHAILNEEPNPLPELRRDIPMELEMIVRKCLYKNPAQRYQEIGSLKTDLMRLRKKIKSDSVWTTKKPERESQTQPLKKFMVPGILAAAFFVLVVSYFVFNWWGPSNKLKKSIAVLPFENLASEKADEVLCFLLTKGVIHRLLELSPELRVVPFASVEKYKGPLYDIKKIKNDLKIDYILSTKVQHKTKRIGIYSELISAENGSCLEVYSHESKLEDYSVIQDEISKKVMGDLGMYFTESGLITAKRRESEKLEASLLYQEGMNLLEKRSHFPSLDEWFSEVLGKFDQALQIDPYFALAYWGKGAVYEACYVETKQRENLVQMLEFFEKAHDLNPDLAETNLSLGWVYFYMEDLDKAYKSFKKALQIGPSDSLVITDAGSFLASIGLYRQAIHLFSRAIRNEPSYLRAYLFKALCHWYVGEFEEGAKTIEERYEIEKANPQIHLLYAQNLIMMGQFAQAQKEIEEAEKREPDVGESSLRVYKALLYAKRGQSDLALEQIKNVKKTYIVPITCIYSLLGMRDEAVDNIKLGIAFGFQTEQRYLYSFPILHDNPGYNNLHSDPRFIEILEQTKKTYHQIRKRYSDL